MKNQIPKESMFKKKGFYVALYSSLGAVMVLAAVVSFNNLQAQSIPPKPTGSVDFSQMETTSKSSTASGSYLLPGDELTQTDDLEAKAGDKMTNPSDPAKPTDPGKKLTDPAKSPDPGKKLTDPEKTSDKPETKTEEKEPAKEDETDKKNKKTKADEKEETAEGETDTETAKEEVTADMVSEPVFSAFEDDDKLSWPVMGSVVMEYSDDHAIYDKTLDQYRTNDVLCISAELGSQVSASAEGVVVKVAKTKENGNTVVIDNGNGWMTTYSQLQDGMLVKEGDVVKKSQVIGGVASPSIYSVLLGNHVGFKVTKDDATVNPVSILE